MEYAFTIFVSAFLLLAIQPLIGKMILPWFGGSAAVWSTCLIYFQISLLLGYLYAHFVARYLTPKRQAVTHVILLAASLGALPAIPRPERAIATGDPAIRIVVLLATTIGLPYLLLSATGPLLQSWYARARSGAPYRLYALSNLGSLLALLSYPFAVEPVTTVRAQAHGWSVCYLLFAAACAVCAVRTARLNQSEARETDAAASAPWWHVPLWAALAACPSGLLLSVTATLTHNVAPLPLLWILPLALYLLSFVFCFEFEGLYRRWIFLPLLAMSLSGMTFAVYFQNGNAPVRITIPLLAAGLFVSAMVCHGELARIKPHPQHLTSFYLAISVGGAAGGFFVGFVAPRVWSDYLEFPVLLVFCAALATLMVWIYVKFQVSRRTWIVRVWMLAGTMVLASYLLHQARTHQLGKSWRNFYGVLRIVDHPETAKQRALRTLWNGTIIHGSQMTAPEYHRIPTAYYGRNSGVGKAVADLQKNGPVRVGLVGLGAGVMGAYCRPGDTFKFYEINPLAVEIARREFTFLSDCPATPEIVLGDARLALQREAPQGFDLLVVDAFTSDSVPAHLLTSEAFRVYFRHLRPSGILAVNVSNRYLNLVTIVAAGAQETGRRATWVVDTGDPANACFGTNWVLVSSNVLEGPAFQGPTVNRVRPASGFRMWTDDYSSLFRILK
jgi:hypothetical protein